MTARTLRVVRTYSNGSVQAREQAINVAPATPPPSLRFPGAPKLGTLLYGASSETGSWAALDTQLNGPKTEEYRSYYQPQDAWANSANDIVAAANSANRLIIPSMKCHGIGTGLKTPDISGTLAGNYNAEIRAFFQTLHASGKRIWPVLHHEPTDNMTPTQYRQLMALWVAQWEQALGASAATSLVRPAGVLNGFELFPGKASTRDQWNPLLDPKKFILGYDNYNQWSPTNGNAWRTPADCLQPGDVIQSWGYSTIVGEYGVRVDPNNPGKAAQWLRDYYALAKQKNVLCVSYFWSGANSPDGTWKFLASDERNGAFKTNLQDSIALKAA